MGTPSVELFALAGCIGEMAVAVAVVPVDAVAVISVNGTRFVVKVFVVMLVSVCPFACTVPDNVPFPAQRASTAGLFGVEGLTLAIFGWNECKVCDLD